MSQLVSYPVSPQRRREAEQPLVIIVDDDASVREALSELILSAGFRPICFASTARPSMRSVEFFGPISN